MQIIPAIDIKNRKCVRLFRGDYGLETIYSPDPVAVAQQWERQGAKALHIVDLDGAKEGKPINYEVIKKIMSQTRLPVQIGGGIRNVFSIYRYIEIGVNKIILGTVVLENRNVFARLVKKFADKIIVSLDVNDNSLMKNGWLEKSKKGLLETVKELKGSGVQSIIYTDTIRDGTLTQPNYEIVQSIKNITKMDVIVAGGISSIKQIIKLKKMNIGGVIIGKALYEGKINLKEAILSC